MLPVLKASRYSERRDNIAYSAFGDTYNAGIPSRLYGYPDDNIRMAYGCQTGLGAVWERIAGGLPDFPLDSQPFLNVFHRHRPAAWRLVALGCLGNECLR
jgi:hypothetical protein